MPSRSAPPRTAPASPPQTAPTAPVGPAVPYPFCGPHAGAARRAAAPWVVVVSSLDGSAEWTSGPMAKAASEHFLDVLDDCLTTLGIPVVVETMPL